MGRSDRKRRERRALWPYFIVVALTFAAVFQALSLAEHRIAQLMGAGYQRVLDPADYWPILLDSTRGLASRLAQGLHDFLSLPPY